MSGKQMWQPVMVLAISPALPLSGPGSAVPSGPSLSGLGRRPGRWRG